MMRSNGIWCLLGFLVVAAIALGGARIYADATLPQVTYLSPMPGAREILPQTNVIVRFGTTIGSEFGALPSILVAGSVSGPHPGSLVLTDDGRTLVFNPSREFAWGERVTVLVARPPASTGSDPEPLTSFSFSIAAAPPPHVPPSLLSELSEATAAAKRTVAPTAGAPNLKASKL